MARRLLAAPAGGQRVELAQRAAADGYTVRRLEELARVIATSGISLDKGPASARSEELVARLAGLRDLERQIGQQLGTKVFISTDRRGKRGRLMIEFYGLDHFDGLLSRLNIRAR